MNVSSHTVPIITVKEARKLLGTDAAHLTDGELELMISQSEQLLRFIFRDYIVRKQTVVK
jgi:hypothetical protein